MHSRRDFGKAVLAGVPLSLLAAKPAAKVAGVTLGVCTYSFRDLPHTQSGDAVDPVISALKQCGASEIELFSPQLEPPNPAGPPPPRRPSAGASVKEDAKAAEAAWKARMSSPQAQKARADLRDWRLSTPPEHFNAVRKKFDDAGISIYAYTVNFRDDFTDEEIDKCFEQSKALGTKVIATSTQLSVAPRLAKPAEKHDIYVALHGHSNTRDSNEFASPETFSRGLAMSRNFRINLDIGHFSAAGFDPVAFIEQHHEHITHLHIKDRKANDGPNMPWGQGDTPIKPVLLLLKDKHYPIPAFVEYEYKGTGSSVEETSKCLDFMKSALA